MCNVCLYITVDTLLRWHKILIAQLNAKKVAEESEESLKKSKTTFLHEQVQYVISILTHRAWM